MADLSDAPCIVWFRDDLRLSDHPALHAAAHTGRPVICLYVFDETVRQPGARPIGGAARWWLAQSLRALERHLRALGMPLLLRKGSAAKVIPELAREGGAGDVFWNAISQAPHQATERDIATSLRNLGIDAHGFAGDLLAAPENVRTKEGRGLRVFTPFWRRVQAMGAPPVPCPLRQTCVRDRTLQARRSKVCTLSRGGRTGRAVCAKPGRPEKAQARSGLRIF